MRRWDCGAETTSQQRELGWAATVVVHGDPTAEAGADQTVATGDTVTVSASATYGWRQTRGKTVTLTGADTKTVTFDIPTNLSVGNHYYQFEFTASYSVVNYSRSASDTITITVIVPDLTLDPPPSKPPTTMSDVQKALTDFLAALATQPSGTSTITIAQSCGTLVITVEHE